MPRVSVSYTRLVRPLLAVGLLGLLFMNLDHAEFLRKLSSAKPLFILAAVGAVVIDGLVRAWNWTQLIRAMHPDKSARFGTVLSLYWAGSFMGHFLPSTAGTDAIRAMLAARRVGGPVSAHAAGVVMLNLLSLISGCAVGLACLAWIWFTSDGREMRWIAFALFSGPVCVGLSGYWLLRNQRGLVLQLLRRMPGRLRKLRRGIRRFVDRLLVFERLDVSARPVIGISILTLLTRASMYALVGRAVGIDLALPAWVALVPGYALSGLMPYSVSGYGGDQAAIVYFLTGFGAPAGGALAFALIVPLITMVFNMLGGFTLLFGGVRLPVEAGTEPVLERNS